MMGTVLEITPSSRPNSRKQRPTDPTLPRKISPPGPRWNAECGKLIRMRKAALQHFQCRGTGDNLINYKKPEANARNELNKIKKESFMNSIDSLTTFTNPSYIWSKIKAFKNRWNNRDNASEYNDENINKATKMIDELCPSCTPSAPPSHRLEGDADPFLDLPFSQEELEYAIANPKISSNPVPDVID
jgi:hypothetical protein